MTGNVSHNFGWLGASILGYKSNKKHVSYVNISVAAKSLIAKNISENIAVEDVPVGTEENDVGNDHHWKD